jgi:hypothetical protein
MYIAYSVLRGQPTGAAPYAETETTETLSAELQLRYQAYQDICNKYRLEIAAIQKYLPGWRPNPPSL